MADVFISYARSSEADARCLAGALDAAGFDVWRDDKLPAHRSYGDVIEEQLAVAAAVIVIWSKDAAQSQWVRSEADRGRINGRLVQLTIDGARLPMPFDQIQCVDLSGWNGQIDEPRWRKVLASVEGLVRRSRVQHSSGTIAKTSARTQAICVLPFANMSGDIDQEYFSDGISEDIITDLSKVSALSVVARNTAFTFKGKAVDITRVAHQLGVTHVLEGSVRKMGSRVRIAAQLIDGAAGDHVWAERWDRDFDDIFALQDEISIAVVGAVKLKLLPTEVRAITRRGTGNADAYDLYLMARQQYASGNQGDPRRDEAIIRLCRRATEIDADYARPWALMALAETSLHFRFGHAGETGLASAEKALELEPALAEAHAIKARHLRELGCTAESFEEIRVALILDPESYEVNLGAGYINFRERRFEDAILYYEKAAFAMESDYHSAGTLLSCYTAVGDEEGAKRAARMTLARAEAAVGKDQANGSAMGYAVVALAALGDSARAKEWIQRALLIDPHNLNMRYNFACALSLYLKDSEAVIGLMKPVLANTTATWLNHVKVDPDLDAVRDEKGFQDLISIAEIRLGLAI